MYVCIYILLVTLYITLSSVNTRKLSTKFYGSYKSLINYRKNSNIKDKIKTNVHFDNTFKVNEQKKDKTNYKLQLRKIDTNKREDIQMVQHF